MGYRLKWVDNNLAEDGYRIYRGEAPLDTEDLPVPLATLGPDATQYDDTTALDDVEYFYRVSAFAGSQEAVSLEVSTTEAYGDPHWDKVVALLHFDGDLMDKKGNAWTGSGLIVPDGRFEAGVNTSAAHIQTPTASWNDLSSGQGDFTVEMFIKQTAPNTASALIAHAFTGTRGSLPFVIAFGKVGTTTPSNQLYFGHFNGSWIGANSTWEPVSGQWHHIAASREGDVYNLFADGVLIASFTSSAAVAANGSALYVGRRWDSPAFGGALFQGVIDELRITKGVARYTENYTPPPEPFPDFETRPPEPILPGHYPTIIGEAFGGGYYIGNVVVADGGEDDGTYSVIVAGPEGEADPNFRLKTSFSTTPGTASVTNGLANTAAMYDDDPVAHEAAAYCVSYEGGGFSDWYIPSIDELRLVWANRSELPDVAMDNQWYWSSTQVTPTSNTQINKNFGNGSEYNSNKTGASFTRPVRRIKLPE